MGMKIIVIGLGYSGAIYAINRKMNHPSDDIMFIEHLDKPLKKVLATGNGKCNIANSILNKDIYNDPFVFETVSKHNHREIINFYDKLGLSLTTTEDGYLYPTSKAATSVRNILLKKLEELKIKVHLSEELVNYRLHGDHIEVVTSIDNYDCDRLVISAGGNASPKLGSNGVIYTILEDHKYEIDRIREGLCPIYTKEDTRILDGVRISGAVTLLVNNKVTNVERGEILFKNKGLSGIVIFNQSRLIARHLGKNIRILIDLLPDISKGKLREEIDKYSSDYVLDKYLDPKIKAYILARIDKNHDLFDLLTSLEFNFYKLYDFEFSQISVGGIKLRDIKPNFESRIERNIYFIGEVLDADGPCGGYNLMWAFASAIEASK